MLELAMIICGIALGATALTIAKLVSDYFCYLSVKLFVLKLLGAMSYAIIPFVPETNTRVLLLVLSAMVPAVFWLFCKVFFSPDDDRAKLSKLDLAVVCVFSFITVLKCFLHSDHSLGQVIEPIHLTFSSVLVVLGLLHVFQHWQADLVESRRSIRMAVACISGLFILFALLNAFLYPSMQHPDWLVLVNQTCMASIALFISYWLMIAKPYSLEEAGEKTVEAPVRPVQTVTDALTLHEQAWLQKLVHAMEQESIYRRNDLTIRVLSKELGIAEHQLRRLINQHLGYRNFNEYLNRFRISDAAERLQDPGQSQLPIITIALESGYASLTTFNKAFKSLKEMTPSEFRRHALSS